MTAVQLARRFANEIARREGVRMYPTDPYGPRVRNKREAKEHGWMRDALATVTYETSGCDLIDILGEWEQPESPFYIEAYSGYMVGVYRR